MLLDAHPTATKIFNKPGSLPLVIRKNLYSGLDLMSSLNDNYDDASMFSSKRIYLYQERA